MTYHAEPIHTHAVGIANVRFFKAPTNSPAHVWFAIEDLMRAYGVSSVERGHFTTRIRNDWPEDVWIAHTSEGPVLIAPHWMALGFIEARPQRP
jgi:hypothetical protein